MKRTMIRRMIILLLTMALLLTHTASFAVAEGTVKGSAGRSVTLGMKASADGDRKEEDEDKEDGDDGDQEEDSGKDGDQDDDDKDGDKDKDQDKDREDDGDTEDDEGDEGDEDEEDEDEDDDEKHSSCTVNPALKYHGPLSDYQPARENVFGPVWGRITVESGDEDDDAHDGKPEYEAVFEGGKLQQLEIEIELSDGTEYEVVYGADKKILRAEYETNDGQIYYNGSIWQDKNGKTVDGPDLSFMEAYYNSYQVKGTWYGNNTMSLIGLSLRDMYPALTDTWYQVVPVDLTQEGTFRYATAASNMFYMGSVIVTVANGTVRVDYTLPEGLVRPESDCLMWFTDISEITSKFLKAPVGTYEFGKAYSIRDDLKGKEIALLFICNHITFRIPMTSHGAVPVKYHRTKACVQEKLAEFEALFARMNQQ